MCVTEIIAKTSPNPFSLTYRPTLLSYRVRLMLPLLILTVSAITSADPRPKPKPQDPNYDENYYYYAEYGEEYGDYYNNYKDNYEEVYNYEDGNERKISK